MADTEEPTRNHLRFIKEMEHLQSPFGEGGFGEKAEAFARFFGTPKFLIGQTVVVASWIAYNAITGVSKGPAFDIYPFILLNLMFSLQAAYAAPLILLAQTRQADRDKAQAEADAKHREAVAQSTQQGIELLQKLLDDNTKLTQQVDALTKEIHGKVISS